MSEQIKTPGLYMFMAHDGFDPIVAIDPSVTNWTEAYGPHPPLDVNPMDRDAYIKHLDDLKNSVGESCITVFVTSSVLMLIHFNDADRIYVVSPDGNWKKMSDHPAWEDAKLFLSPAEFWVDSFHGPKENQDWINS